MFKLFNLFDLFRAQLPVKTVESFEHKRSLSNKRSGRAA